MENTLKNQSERKEVWNTPPASADVIRKIVKQEKDHMSRFMEGFQVFWQIKPLWNSKEESNQDPKQKKFQLKYQIPNYGIKTELSESRKKITSECFISLWGFPRKIKEEFSHDMIKDYFYARLTCRWE